jgi:hypothetical protein
VGCIATLLEQLVQLSQIIAPVVVPDCLKRPEFEFCKVGYTTITLGQLLPNIKNNKEATSTFEQFKRPRGKGWETQTFRWDSPGLQEWVDLGGNYGIVAGGSWEYDGKKATLFIMDADNPPAIAKTGFEADLPRDTMRVKTGRVDPAPGGHIYFLTDIKSTKAHYEIPGYCHFKFYHSQCVGPASLHPSGRRYELVDSHSPAYVDGETLAQAIIKTVQALAPAKLKDVKDMLDKKASHAGQRLQENADRLEDLLKQSKIDNIKQNQQAEVQTEIAYNAIKAQNKQSVDLSKDERINPCLKRLTANIISGKASRFEQVVAYQGKIGEGEHHLRLAWATALVKAGYDDEQIHEMAQHFDDYNWSRTGQQITSIRGYVDNGGNYHPCSTLRAYIPPDWCRGCKWTPPDGAKDELERAETKKESGNQLAPKKEIAPETMIDPSVTTQAQAIINKGEFPQFWVKVFKRRHRGDRHVAMAMPAANLTANITNSVGIAVLQIAGTSGDGKSHAVGTAAQQMGRWCDISGLSPMALLYHGGDTVQTGMMVVMDDNRPDERQGDIVKRAQTQFKTGYKYKTVLQGKAKTLQMPAGVQLLTTQVDADSEDQVLNRTLLLEVKGSPEKDLAIISADLDRLETGEQPLNDPDIAICQAALDILKSHTYEVIIPDAKKHIKWLERSKGGRANLRNYNIFRDLIMSFAVMRYPQRIHSQDNEGIIHVEATKQDFKDALAFYHSIHKQMQDKLTSKEIELIELVKGAGGRLSRQDAMIKMNPPISKGRLTQLVQGKDGKGGLLNKVPGFYLEDTTESSTTISDAGTYDPHVKRRYLCLIEDKDSNLDGPDDGPVQKRLDSTYRAAKWED